MTEDEEVREGVAAEAVAAVNAARDFTRGEKARDGFALFVENAGFLVDLQAAHRVVDRDGERNRVEGSLFDAPAEDGLGHGKARGVRLLRSGVVGSHGLHEALRVDPGELREFFQGVRAVGVAAGDRGFDLFLAHALRIDRALVVYREAHLAGLLEDRVGDVVAAAGFVGEALTEFVDVGGVLRAARDGAFKVAVLGIAVRVDLDPLHAFQRRARLHGFFNHFARGAGLIRRGRDRNVVVLLHHVEVRAVAARGEDDALGGGEDVFFSCLVDGANARDAAVFFHKRRHLHVREDGRARGLHLVGERPDVGVIGGDRRHAVLGARHHGARIKRPDPHVDEVARAVFPGHVGLRVKPLHGFGRVLRHREDELRIGLVVAADERLERKEFGRVEDVLLPGLEVFLVLGLHLRLQVLDFALGHVGLEVLLHDRVKGVVHGLQLFRFGIDRGHVAFASRGVAADHRHLFEDDHLGALADRSGGGDHAGPARAHDHDVGFRRKDGGVKCLLGGGLEELVFGAGLLQGRGHGRAQGVRGNGGARNGVDARRLGFDDRLGKVFDGERADPRGFLVARHLNGRDAVLRDVDLDVHGAVAALGGGFIGAGGHGDGLLREKKTKGA